MQSNLDQRIFFYDASENTFTDCTVALNEWNNNKTAAIVFDEGDYLYISSFLPFNHKYFGLSSPSDSNRTATIELLNAPAEWDEVVDTLDYTNGMQANGVIQWTPNYDKNWGMVSDSSREIPALVNGPTIYDSYWMRISFPVGSDFTLNYIGQKFSSDSDLYMEYPQLQNTTILNSWKVGKTDWNDQHLLAATYIAKTLKQRNIVINDNQILDIASLRNPSVHKAAQIIFSGLGARNYAEEIKLAAQCFEAAMTQDKFRTDTNANARLDRSERIIATTGRANR